MSADNGHIIRNTSDGKFALQMYFDSAETYPDVEETPEQDRYDSLEKAVAAYNEMCRNSMYVDEYGLTLLVKEKSPDISAMAAVIKKALLEVDSATYHGRSLDLAKLAEKTADEIATQF